MRINQIFEYRCMVCGCKYGCYDSCRTVQKKKCPCDDICPKPNEDPSTGYCEKHFQEALEISRMKRNGEHEKVQNS